MCSLSSCGDGEPIVLGKISTAEHLGQAIPGCITVDRVGEPASVGREEPRRGVGVPISELLWRHSKLQVHKDITKVRQEVLALCEFYNLTRPVAAR